MEAIIKIEYMIIEHKKQLWLTYEVSLYSVDHRSAAKQN
jgi:hypothetical protein